MVGAEGPGAALQQLLLDPERLVDAAGLETGTRHAPHRQEGFGVVRAQCPAALLEHLLLQLERLVAAAGIGMGGGEVGERRERAGVIRGEDPAALLKHLLLQLERLVAAAGVAIASGQVVHRRERVGVFRAVGRQAEVAHRFQLADRLLVEPESLIGPGQRPVQHRPAVRLPGEPGIQPRRGPVEQFGHGDRPPVAHGIRAFEDHGQEPGSLLGLLARLGFADQGRFGRRPLVFGRAAGDAGLVRPPQAQHHAGDQRERDRGGRGDAALVAAQELPQPVAAARRASPHRLVPEVVLEVVGQRLRAVVAPLPLLLQRPQHDPVQFPADTPAQPRRGRAPPLRRLLGGGAVRLDHGARVPRLRLPHQPQHLGQPGLAQRFGAQRRAARQQLVEDHSQRVDVAAGVEVGRRPRLLRAHVLRGAEDDPLERHPHTAFRPAGIARQRLGDAEVDHPRHGPAVDLGDQDVGRLEVAVEDRLLVGMVHRVADRHEQLEPLAQAQPVAVAVVGDGHAAHQLHDEVRSAVVGGPRIEHAGDVRVLHECQRPPLALEAPDDLLAVHSRLDHLEGHLTPDRLGLRGAPHAAEAAVAQHLEQGVGTDGVPGLLARASRQCQLDEFRAGAVGPVRAVRGVAGGIVWGHPLVTAGAPA